MVCRWYNSNEVKIKDMTPEEKREYHRAYRAKNKEKLDAYHKSWSEDNSDRLREKAKAHYRDNKEAKKEYDKAYREKNKDKISAQLKVYRKANKFEFDFISSKIYGGQTTHSKRRGHNPPDYTLEELRSWLKEQPNLNSLMEGYEKSGGDKWLSPSVDRIDNSKGYSFDNIQLMTFKENHEKG
jgi:hypothetical protein